jgi:hypothetical protein
MPTPWRHDKKNAEQAGGVLSGFSIAFHKKFHSFTVSSQSSAGLLLRRQSESSTVLTDERDVLQALPSITAELADPGDSRG